MAIREEKKGKRGNGRGAGSLTFPSASFAGSAVPGAGPSPCCRGPGLPCCHCHPPGNGGAQVMTGRKVHGSHEYRNWMLKQSNNHSSIFPSYSPFSRGFFICPDPPNILCMKQFSLAIPKLTLFPHPSQPYPSPPPCVLPSKESCFGQPWPPASSSPCAGRGAAWR